MMNVRFAPKAVIRSLGRRGRNLVRFASQSNCPSAPIYRDREGLPWPMRIKSTLSEGEYASLLEVSTGFLHHAIPADDAAQLMAMGLVYNLLGSIRLTTAGRARLKFGI